MKLFFRGVSFKCLCFFKNSSPYIIYNNKRCDVELHDKVFDPSSGCTLQCSANNVIIPAGGNISITCVVAGNSDIEIVLIGMGGQAISPIANVNYGSGTGGGGFGLVLRC